MCIKGRPNFIQTDGRTDSYTNTNKFTFYGTIQFNFLLFYFFSINFIYLYISVPQAKKKTEQN